MGLWESRQRVQLPPCALGGGDRQWLQKKLPPTFLLSGWPSSCLAAPVRIQGLGEARGTVDGGGRRHLAAS